MSAANNRFHVPTGTGQQQSAQALYIVIETSVYTVIETCMSISYIWSAFTNVHSMRGTYLFQPKTITYIFCNANDYYPGLINSELSMRWTRYSCGQNKCSFSYNTRIKLSTNQLQISAQFRQRSIKFPAAVSAQKAPVVLFVFHIKANTCCRWHL